MIMTDIGMMIFLNLLSMDSQLFLKEVHSDCLFVALCESPSAVALQMISNKVMLYDDDCVIIP